MAARRTIPGAGQPPDGAPELVGNLLERARDTTSKRAGRGVDAGVWLAVVGRRIAERASPGRIDGGVLSVNVASSVWAQELSFLERELLERLNAVGVLVTSLRFRVVAKPQAPIAARPEPRAPRPAPPLPPDLEQRLARVDDPELRAAIAEAAGRWLSLEKDRGKPVTSPKQRARGPRSDARESDRPDPAGRRPPAGSGRSS